MWNRPTKQLIYQKQQFPSSTLDTIATAMHEIGYQTPLAFTAIYDIATIFPDKIADEIATKCRGQSKDSWDRIACASKSVHAVLANDKHVELGRFNTFCYTHAEAFSKVFERLKIPRANVGKVSANTTGPYETYLHVANRITVTDINGKTYSYIIDVGWFPNKIFTNTSSTTAFHDRDGDGKFDALNLPTLPAENEQPKYHFGPAPAKQQAVP